MLKRTTKRTTVILLALVMSLGLFVAGYGGTEQTINANISPTVSLNSAPSITTWNMTPQQENTTPGGTATVDANCPYTLTVKSSTAGDGDQFMTGDQNSTDLTNAFQLQYNSSGSDVTSKGSTISSLAAVTTPGDSAPTLFEELTAPSDGSDAVRVKFSQTLQGGDPAYSGTTQINYSIILVWTASVSV